METASCFMDDPRNRIARYRALNVLPNGYSISALHLLLVAREHREDLRAEDLASALDFVREFPQYFLFFNTRGAGATRPEHLHGQAILRGEALPIEVAPRRELFSLNEAVVMRVEDYPVYGLGVRGRRAADVALAILQALHPTPFNLVLSSRGEVLVVPRQCEEPTGFGRFGGLEMGGWVVLTDEERYRSVTYPEIRQALAECGLPEGARESFEWAVLHALVCLEVGSGNGRAVRLGSAARAGADLRNLSRCPSCGAPRQGRRETA